MIKRRQHIDIAGASKVIDGAVIALDGEIARIDTKQSDLSSRIRVLERELHRSTEIKTQLENSNKEFVLRKQQQIANNKGGGFDEGKWLYRTSDGQAYASNAKQIAVRKAEISARINEWELIEQ